MHTHLSLILSSVLILGSCTKSQVKAYIAPAAPISVVQESYSLELTSSVNTIEEAVSTTTLVTLTLKNNGSGRLTNLSFPSLTGDWIWGSTNCSSLLNAKESCSKELRFSPRTSSQQDITLTIATAETKSAALKITANSYDVASISAVYPTNGAKWNDYIVRSSISSDKFSQADTACQTTDTGIGKCFHAGSMRKATLANLTSCSGVTIVDSLQALQWFCKVETNGSVTAYSSGLREDKRLIDLVDDSSWKKIYLKVTKSSRLTHKSVETTWWTNTVTPLPSNSKVTDSAYTLSTPSVIYTLTSSRATQGYYFQAGKIGLAMKRDVVLHDDGLPPSIYILDLNVQEYIWVEGNFRTQYLTINGGVRSMIRDSKFYVPWQAGGSQAIASGDATMHRNIQIFGTGLSCMSIISYNSPTNPPVFDRVNIYNADGFYTGNGTALFTRSNFMGVDSTTSAPVSSSVVASKIILHASTVMNNVYSTGAYNSVAYSQSVFLNNGRGLVRPDSVSIGNAILANVISANNGTYGFHINTGSAVGNIVSSGNTSGLCTAGGSSPLANTTCAAQNGSTANVNTALTGFANSYVGGVTSKDSKNGSNSLGSQAYASITDYFNFENLYRMWGMLSSGFPSATQRSSCTTGTCQIWDLRIKKTDTLMLNRSDTLTATNDAFKANATCPSAVSGNKIVTLTSGVFGAALTRDYLINAVEIPDDPYGNDDGLCESNEACIYHPNYGSYLGEGDWLANGTCAFQDGVVSGVKMYAYPTNGAD